MIRWKRQLVTKVYKATHNLTPPYITSVFPPKIVNYDLRLNMPISQPKFQTQTHGYHSLRNVKKPNISVLLNTWL